MPDNHRLTAVEKALAVMEAVANQPQAVGLPDLAARLELPRQTVHRLLVQLERAGLVVRYQSRERYSVGPRLSKLAFATLRSLNQGAPIRSILQDLVDEIGETCNVGVLDGLDYVYLQRIECEWPLRLHMEIGTRIGAHCVSGGKLLLAHLEPELCQRLLRSRKLKKSTSRTLTNVVELETELERIRARGYGVNNQEQIDGIVGIAVPVIDSDGRVLAAVGVQGPLPRFTLKACERHLPRLREAAGRIARAWLE
jgi:DNA-binding IclR family transcriptional regulator